MKELLKIFRESIPEMIGGLLVASILAVFSIADQNLRLLTIGLLVILILVGVLILIRHRNKETKNIDRSTQLKTMLNIAEEILETANLSLIENERILAPLYQDISKTKSVYGHMMELYQNQRNRGDFGKWMSYLEKTFSSETDEEIRNILRNLLWNIDILYNAFYKNRPGHYIWDSEKGKADKLTIAKVLEGKEYKLNSEAIIEMITEYLNDLREAVEYIGLSVGTLRAMVK